MSSLLPTRRNDACDSCLPAASRAGGPVSAVGSVVMGHFCERTSRRKKFNPAKRSVPYGIWSNTVIINAVAIYTVAFSEQLHPGRVMVAQQTPALCPRPQSQMDAASRPKSRISQCQEKPWPAARLRSVSRLPLRAYDRALKLGLHDERRPGSKLPQR